jgi:DNA-binding LytR/AlgR family response regulator
MIKALIIEDEKPAASRLLKMLGSLDPSIEVAERIDTIENAVKWLKTNPHPDLIFLDIQLGDGLSFEIFSRVSVSSYIIFTTAFDEYAIRAFELNSIDYLLKPVSEEKMAKSIAKFKRFREQGINPDIGKLLHTLQKRERQFRKRFLISVAGRIRIVETSGIAYFLSKDKSSYLCSDEKKVYPLEYSLDQIEEMLDPDEFFRVNRQFIVRYKAIEKIDLLSKSRIRITTNPAAGEEILVSAAKTPEFRNWLDR